MNLHTCRAALLVILALAGCTQETTAQAGARYAPYSSDNNGIRPGHGGGDGGGDGGMQPAWWGEVDPLLSPSSHLDARAAAGFKLHLVKRTLPPGEPCPLSAASPPSSPLTWRGIRVLWAPTRKELLRS